MSAWETSRGISRAEAIERIKALAEEQGISGAFKVAYDGRSIDTEQGLPERVDMDKVTVSGVHDQA